MLKNLQKGLISAALLAAPVLGSAQTAIVTENFQSWTEAGYTAAACTFVPAATPPATGGNQYNSTEPSTGVIGPLTKTYPGGISINYTIVNGGVNPTCAARGGTSTTAVRAGSVGFIELTKDTENSPAIPGSLTLSKIDQFITTVQYTASWTGGGRSGGLFKSKDGIVWDTVDTFTGDGYGVEWESDVFDSGVLLRFAALTGAASQRTKIHDIIINASPLGLESSYVTVGGAIVSSENNIITVNPTESVAVEIADINGTVVASKVLSKNIAESFTINNAGLYFVRVVNNGKVSVKKVVVQ